MNMHNLHNHKVNLLKTNLLKINIPKKIKGDIWKQCYHYCVDKILEDKANRVNTELIEANLSTSIMREFFVNAKEPNINREAIKNEVHIITKL